MKNRLFKNSFIIIACILVAPSIIYLIQNTTVLGFKTYYNFFINENFNKTISSVIYIILFLLFTALYIILLKKENFKSFKKAFTYIALVSGIFILMLPWTSSDIFYYMGVGELNSQYGQNPYYISIKQYCNENKEEVNDDSIMKQGHNNYWADTTVIYGPVAQIIFTVLTKLSFKNINICLFLFNTHLILYRSAHTAGSQ